MSVETLLDKYYTTAGRNTNMLIGVVIDQRGLVPEGDVQRMKEFGDEIKKRFVNPVAKTSGDGEEVLLKFKSQMINHVVLMEDIKDGERVRTFEILGKKGEKWISLGEGSCIGHKYIHRFDAVELSAVKVKIHESIAQPKIRDLSVYHIVE
jgi:alpha-L-fucosidase